MKYLPDSEAIFCTTCAQWYRLRPDTYIPGDGEGREEIVCLHCNTTLGFTWDIPEVFLPEFTPGRSV